MIDWSCVKIVKHVCKKLIYEGWALWAKLETHTKEDVCDYPTIPAK